MFDSEKIKDIDSFIDGLRSKDFSLYQLWHANETGDSELIDDFEKLYKILLKIVGQCDNLVDETNWKPVTSEKE